MKELQSFVENFGLRISVEELADKAYNHMARLGHEVLGLNEKYIIVDGVRYMFSKSRKAGRWVVSAW